MSRPRKLGVTIALVLAPVVLVSAIGVGWFFASLPNVGDFFDYGYLGPPERRQRTELAEHGFAIAFADDWVVEEQAGDSAEAKRVGMREVLTARSAGEVPRCTVNVVLAEEAGTAEDVLRVWAPADARQADYGTYRGQDVPEGVVGTAFCDMAGSWRADWYVPLTDDAVLFTCVLLNEACPDADVELSGLVMWGMLPIVRSIEPLAAPSPPATDTALGQGRRVETPSGLILTFPQGWTINAPDTADEETVIPSLSDLLARRLEPLVAPWMPSPTMSAVRYAQDDGGEPLESCTVGAVPGWFYDEPLEQVVALMLGRSLEEADAPLVTYLDLPVGRVARADVHQDGVRESTYLLPSRRWLHLLVCRGPEGVATGWDAIVSSIEHVVADG